MINQNRMPRYVRCFINPDSHPDPTPSDWANRRATRVWSDIHEMSDMARIILWELVVREYRDELRAEMSKQRHRARVQKSAATQRQRD